MAYNGIDNASTNGFLVELSGFGFNFRQLMIQEFTPPKRSTEHDTHGNFAGKPDIKTPKKPKVDELKFKLLIPLGQDSTLEQKFVAAQVLPASLALENVIFIRTDSNGLPTGNRYLASGFFFSEITDATYARGGDSKNAMYDCTGQCTDYVQI